MALSRRFLTVATLGTTQTLAWASSYYLLGVLAEPMSRDLGTTPSILFAAFSLALMVSAAIGPLAGKVIDRFGGKPVLLTSNVIFSLGLLGLSYANVSLVFVAWLVIGIAMGSGLYEAAFSTVVRLYGHNSRGAITGITLFAGFASTVGWPLTAWMETHLGWRGACVVWACLHLFVALPLNLTVPKASQTPEVPKTGESESQDTEMPPAQARRATFLLAYIFAVAWFIGTSMAAHLPHILQISGLSLVAAVAVAALVGPAQVAGRLLEFGFLKRTGPMLSARLAALAHPAAVGVLLVFGAPAAAVFAVLHGMGNGVTTIAIGTLPLILFGPKGYGRRQGMLMIPARIVQATAPFLFGLCIERWDNDALWLTAALGLTAAGALVLLKAPTKAIQPA